MKTLKKSVMRANGHASSPSLSSSSSSSSYSVPFSVEQQQHSKDAYNSTLQPLHRFNHISSADPEIVIRALCDYRAQRIVELSFKTGELLQALGEAWPPDGSEWFEATNPSTGARGFVPRQYFQVFSQVHPTTRPRLAHSSNSGNPIMMKAMRLHSRSTPKPPPKSQSYTSPCPPSTLTSKFPSAVPPSNQPSRRSPQPLYGVVRHDFKAERVDELGARRGEAIILIAHSHYEWFVAKPIGRLGGPGLIPVSFVEVKDLGTGKGLREGAVKHLMGSGVIPGVDEWKRAAAAYRGNSIPLGKFESPPSIAAQSFPSVPRMKRGVSKSHQQLRPSVRERKQALPDAYDAVHSALLMSQAVSASAQQVSQPVAAKCFSSSPPPMVNASKGHSPNKKVEDSLEEPRTMPNESPGGSGSAEKTYATIEALRERYGILIHASVESFHMEDSKYWFHLRAHFNRPSSKSATGEETTVLVLYRQYDEFFDFHAGLLDSFPVEAGRESMDQPSIIPKLPEPKEHVDDLVCAERVNGLSTYLKSLSQLPTYIRECELFYDLLGPREGDVELQEERVPSPGSPVAEGAVIKDGRNSNPSPGDQVDFSQWSAENMEEEIRNESLAVRRSTWERQRRSSRKLRLNHSSHNLAIARPQDGSFPGSPPTDSALTGDNLSRSCQVGHQSNFSSSTSASIHTSPIQAVTTPEKLALQSPKAFHRIKIYQECTTDVIAIKVPADIKRAELVNKVRERVKDSAIEAHLNSRRAKLFIKTCESKNRMRWTELNDDEQMAKWMVDCESRLALLYSTRRMTSA